MDNSNEIDLDKKSLNLFSRQNAALGAETTAKLIKMKVLLFGLRGVGVETAKNLALQGVGAINLIDPKPAEVQDIGQNFFIQKSDLGKPRADIVAPRLQELNPLCQVSTSPSITEDLIKSHSALVLTQILPLEELLQLNVLCRKHNVSFFYTFIGGVSTDIFVDHGENHTVFDFDGERPIQKLVVDVTRLNDNEVLVRYETPEGQVPLALSSGVFELTEINGISNINGKTYEISHPFNDPVKTFRIKFPMSSSERYEFGGLISEKKIPTKYPMKSLSTKLQDPGNPFSEPPSLVLTDLQNFGSEFHQHVSFYAVHVFFSQFQRFPTPHNVADIEKVLEIAKGLLEEKKVTIDSFEIDENYVKRYAKIAGVELQPMAAFTGGVLAQEIVKCTGKFTPIPGFMHFSAYEALPEDECTPKPEDTQPKGSPNDEIASIYGWPFVEKLGSLKYFMVGCGALGCEFMKNYALNGVCCGENGKLFVTDADRIELSNLSRQFLFREHNVGHPKSKAAAVMAQVMNPKFNVEAYEHYVGPKSEDIFHDEFWGNLDGICNALDNMEARLYVDKQCVKYEKPLLESGTMGTSGNVDTICPFKTRTYKEGGNAAEGGGVPMCTLRNFPHLTDHCIEWARDQFELLFSKLGKSLEAYLKDPKIFESKIRDKASSEPGAAFFDIRSVNSFANLVSKPTIGAAAQLAYDIFYFLFRDRILDLQAAFPADFRVIDAKTKADKGPFWGEKKRYPTVVKFNPQDDAHTQFILSSTCLFSVAVGLIPPKQESDDEWLKDYRNREWVASLVSELREPPYIQAPVSSEGIDNAPEMDKSKLDSILTELFQSLDKSTSEIKEMPTLEIAEFEKDDDLNFHIDFVTSAANLRCDNYSIKRTDFHSCKIIAGKIIAAIATTTAAVCGLVMLELFKVVMNKKTESYMNRAIGLAQYSYTSFTAEEPYKFKSKKELVEPDPLEPLPEEAYDEHGEVKKEYYTEVVKRAYPEGHSVWDKITVDGSLTFKEFSTWFETNHGLRLMSWDFIYGYRNTVDEETKSKSISSVSAPVYPPKPLLDHAHIPSLDLNLSQATMMIMKNPQAKPTQQYLALWRECKAKGFIPKQTEKEDAITEDTTIKQILQKMSQLADEKEASGEIDAKAIPSIANRKFIVIPGGETPIFSDIQTGEDIEYMSALKIML